MTQAVEITRFKMAHGYTIADFVKANTDVDHWLHLQPGFLARQIIQEEDATVMDLVFFRTAKEAAQSAERLMRELSSSPVHAIIDQRTVSWQVAELIHEIGA
jgi:hypothetical protein